MMFDKFTLFFSFRTAPAKVQNVRVAKNPRFPQTSLIVTYDDPDSTEKTYRAVALSDKGEEVARGESSSGTIAIHGLRPGNAYNVKVVAIHGNLESKPAYCMDLVRHFCFNRQKI